MPASKVDTSYQSIKNDRLKVIALVCRDIRLVLIALVCAAGSWKFLATSAVASPMFAVPKPEACAACAPVTTGPKKGPDTLAKNRKRNHGGTRETRCHPG